MVNFEDDLNFIILLTEFRFAGLRATVTTAKDNFNNADCICVVPKDSNSNDLLTALSICPVVEGGNTISSMINTGIQKSKKSWNLIVMSGNIIRYNPVMKYKRFLKSEKDVMYRVTDTRHWKWADASIHGILIHKNAIKEIGAFLEDEESLPVCKRIWSEAAMRRGYEFKGLVGVKLL